MTSLSRPAHIRWFATVLVLTFLLLASPTAVQVHGGEESTVGTEWSSLSVASVRVLSRRRLTGPGSSPPTCISRCGSCSPCEPVIVNLRSVRTLSPDYKPQVWRCKCGDKLFLP